MAADYLLQEYAGKTLESHPYRLPIEFAVAVLGGRVSKSIYNWLYEFDEDDYE